MPVGELLDVLLLVPVTAEVPVAVVVGESTGVDEGLSDSVNVKETVVVIVKVAEKERDSVADSLRELDMISFSSTIIGDGEGESVSVNE